MKVTVKQGIRCVHAGSVYADGASADVPDEVAREWLAKGWCTEPPNVRPRAKAET
jgi:hypothetical protein